MSLIDEIYPPHLAVFIKLVIPNLSPHGYEDASKYREMEKAKWVAMDINGDWFAFINKPEFRADGDVSKDGLVAALDGCWYPDRSHYDWRGAFFLGRTPDDGHPFEAGNSLMHLDNWSVPCVDKK